MSFIMEVPEYLRSEGVGTLGTGATIILSSKGVIPIGDGPLLTIRETGGFGLDMTQTGGLQCPSAHLVAIALDYNVALQMARKAYYAFVDRLEGKLKVLNRVIGGKTVSISTLTRVGTIATAVTTESHRLWEGQTVEIVGSITAGYNGSVVITGVPSSKSFTFTVLGSPGTPALGTKTATFAGTFYLKIWPIQEPYDLGLDTSERARVAFNISAVKHPS